MEFSLNEEQQMLKRIAREFLDSRCPKSLVREMMTDEVGYSPELWQEMAGLGWQGIMLPESYDGSGGNFIDMVVLLEEIGRALLPGPFVPTAIYGGLGVLLGGNSEQKQAFLPQISQGNLVFSLGLQDSTDRFDAPGITLMAVRQDGHFVLNGVKRLVPDAHVAQQLIIVGRTIANDLEGGITAFIVDAQSPGLSIIPRTTLDGRKLCEVQLQGVTVAEPNVLQGLHQGWPLTRRLIRYGTVGLCAEAVGGAQAAMEMSVDYSKERVQFGRPIGVNQAVKHKCTNMFIEVECARSILYWAAWAVSEDVPEATLAVSMAKAWCSDMYRRVTADALQVHGGIGFTWDSDIHLYLKRAKTIEYTMGDADYHRELVAQEIQRQAIQETA